MTIRRMFPAFLCVLSLCLTSAAVVRTNFENLDSSEMREYISRSVSELSTKYLPRIANSLQGAQSQDVMQRFLELRTSEVSELASTLWPLIVPSFQGSQSPVINKFMELTPSDVSEITFAYWPMIASSLQGMQSQDTLQYVVEISPREASELAATFWPLVASSLQDSEVAALRKFLDLSMSDVSDVTYEYWPLVTSSLQDMQSQDALKKLLELSQVVVNSASGKSDINLASTIKLEGPDQRSIISSISKTIQQRPEALAPLLKTLTSTIERILPDSSFETARNNNGRAFGVVRNSQPNVRNSFPGGVLSDDNVKLYLSSGLLDPGQFSDSMKDYLNGIPSFSDNRNKYNILPNSPAKEKFSQNRVYEMQYSDESSSTESSDYESEEDTISEGSSEEDSLPSRSKRSIAKRKSLYSAIENAMSDSKALADGLNSMASPESKDSFANLFSMIDTFLGDNSDSKLLDELKEAIEATYETMPPEKLIEAFANALEKLLESENRLTSESYMELYQRYISDLSEAVEAFGPNDDAGAKTTVLGMTIYGFLLGEELTEYEHLQTLMENVTKELYALSGIQKTNKSKTSKSKDGGSQSSEKHSESNDNRL